MDLQKIDDPTIHHMLSLIFQELVIHCTMSNISKQTKCSHFYFESWEGLPLGGFPSLKCTKTKISFILAKLLLGYSVVINFPTKRLKYIHITLFCSFSPHIPPHHFLSWMFSLSFILHLSPFFLYLLFNRHISRRKIKYSRSLIKFYLFFSQILDCKRVMPGSIKGESFKCGLKHSSPMQVWNFNWKFIFQ